MPIKVIARVMGISRNTVRAALASDGPPGYRRPPAGSIVDPVEPAIRELLRAFPTMPATVIAERIGWDRGITVLKDRVAELRPVYLPPDPASRTSYAPGELAQCDFWFPEIELPVGFGQTRTAKQLPVLTMVTRLLAVALSVADPVPVGGGSVRRLVAADQRSGWGARGCWSGTVRARSAGIAATTSLLTVECQAFRGTLATQVYVCKPADPEAKGLVERANGYLETSFLPGRSFTSPADFNVQLGDWLSLVNPRQRRVLGCAPTDRIAADRAAMIACRRSPPATGWRSSTRLARDHYVRLDSNDYSVHPAVIGRRIEVDRGPARVRVLCEGTGRRGP